MTSGVHAHRGVRRAAMLTTLAAVLAVFAPLQTPQAQAAKPLEVLQLNLCHSGLADCSSGDQSVDSAIGLINERKPAVVTLNEVCAHDITKMTRETGYLWEFTPAWNRSTDAPYQCADGRGDYGIAILSNPEQGSIGEGVVEKRYVAQDGSEEQRVMLCVPYAGFSACTTHLSADSGEVAAKQCRELVDVARRFGAKTVIGGDFNLRYGGNPDIQDCVPEGWFRKGDGSVQHVFATDSFRFGGLELLPVEGTDHPGFLVELAS